MKLTVCKRGLHKMSGDNVFVMPNGKRQCVACRRTWLAKNRDRILQSHRDRYAANSARLLEEQRKTRAENPQGHRDRIARYVKTHPERRNAVLAVCRAIISGRLTRGPCAVCGKVGKNDAHHHDYSKPLDVIWLCRSHHVRLHKSGKAFDSVLPNNTKKGE